MASAMLRRLATRPAPQLLRASSSLQPASRLLSSGGGGGSVRTVDASGNDVELGPDEIAVRTLYRDCMRLTYHIAARSAKGEAMRQMVRAQFKAQMHVTDEQEVRRLKMLAIAGIQNYVIHEQTGKAIEQRNRDAAGAAPETTIHGDPVPESKS